MEEQKRRSNGFDRLGSQSFAFWWGPILSVITILFLEFVLQGIYFYSSKGELLFRRAIESIYEPDPIRGYRVRPGLSYRRVTYEFDTMVYTNSKGMRTSHLQEEYSYEKAPGTKRVLFLGPSFAFGTAVEYEEMFTTLLIARLKLDGMQVEGINIGTPAQGILAQLRWFREEGYRYSPDVVVQVVYGSPFLFGAMEQESLPTLHDQIETFQSPFFVEDGFLVGKNTSLLDRVIGHGKKSAIVFFTFLLKNALFSGTDDMFEGTGRVIRRNEKLDETSSLLSVAMSQYREYLGFIREVAGEKTKVIFLYLPLSYIVHPEYRSRWQHWGLRERDIAFNDSRLINRALHESGTLVIDPTDDLMEKGKSEKMYNYIDIHFTPEGNKVVANALYDYSNEIKWF